MKSSKEISREKLSPSLFDPLYFTHHSTLSFIKSFLKSNDISRKRILDIGCGIKPYEPLFHAKEYLGSDIKDNGFADIICANWNLKLKTNSVEILLSSFVLEHTLYLEKSIKEMRRVLKKNGLMLIIVPFTFPEHEVPNDFWRFTRFSLQELFKKSQIEQLKPSNGYITTIATTINLFLNQSLKIEILKKPLFFVINLTALITEIFIFRILLFVYKNDVKVIYNKSYFSLPLNYLLVVRNKK